MFNSFYESMPPIELGKNKSLAFISGFFMLFGILLVVAGSGIYWIVSNAENAINYFGLITIIAIMYLSGKGIFNAYQKLFLPYSKKNYKIGYSSLQQIKRSIMFQMIFLGISVVTAAFFSVNVLWTIVKIIYVASMSLMLFVSVAIYMGVNSLLTPFKDELRNNRVKQQQDMQQKMKQDPRFGAQWGGGFSGRGQQVPPKDQEGPTVFSDDHEEPGVSDEEIVRSSGGKVIDITDDINTDMQPKKDEKKEKDSSEGTSKPSEPFSAF